MVLPGSSTRSRTDPIPFVNTGTPGILDVSVGDAGCFLPFMGQRLCRPDFRRKPGIDRNNPEKYNPIWDYNEGETFMDPETMKLLAGLNCAVIQFLSLIHI